MGRITFILGGVRSGKSTFALKLAKERARKVAFIATCEPLDAEMKRRIRRHKNCRPRGWKTFEAPLAIAEVFRKIDNKFELVIVDCLTLFVSNLMLKGFSEARIAREIKAMLTAAENSKAETIIVSNEVGLGIVPESELGRKFRDIAGRVNQLVAREADACYFTIAGLPLSCNLRG
jgi:adenosylcobinamide kinase/adenosylcobinamide-phosphate guanylyltransferase